MRVVGPRHFFRLSFLHTVHPLCTLTASAMPPRKQPSLGQFFGQQGTRKLAGSPAPAEQAQLRSFFSGPQSSAPAPPSAGGEADSVVSAAPASTGSPSTPAGSDPATPAQKQSSPPRSPRRTKRSASPPDAADSTAAKRPRAVRSRSASSRRSTSPAKGSQENVEVYVPAPASADARHSETPRRLVLTYLPGVCLLQGQYVSKHGGVWACKRQASRSEQAPRLFCLGRNIRCDRSDDKAA